MADRTETTERPVWPQPDTVLLQLTVAARSSFAVGLPVIATACEDAATEIILLRGRIQRAEARHRNRRAFWSAFLDGLAIFPVFIRRWRRVQ